MTVMLRHKIRKCCWKKMISIDLLNEGLLQINFFKRKMQYLQRAIKWSSTKRGLPILTFFALSSFHSKTAFPEFCPHRFFFFFFFLLNFLCCVANSQCCDSFSLTAKGLSHIYTCFHSPQGPLPARLPHNIEQSSTCYTLDPYWLSILNIAVCTCPSPIPSLQQS